MNKRKLICLLLCVVMVAGLAVPGTLAIGSATTGSIKVTQNGESVSSVAIPQNGNVILTASGAGSYQWQILAVDTWVNIQGETGAEIRLTYAMVANLMPTSVRCAGDDAVSKEIAVAVGEDKPFPEAPEFVRPAADSEPVAVLNETEQKVPAQDAKAEYDRLNDANNAARDALDKAQADYDAAVKAKEDGPAIIAAAEENLSAAQAALEAARNAVPETAEGETGEEAEAPAPEGPSVDELQANVDQAAQALQTAQDNYANADAVIEAAAAVLEQAQADKDAAFKAKQDYTTNMGASNGGSNGVSTLADDPAVPATHSVVIKYLFADGTEAAATYTATVGHGTTLNVTVSSPAVQGYKPRKDSVTIDQVITEDYIETIYYDPAEVKLTVNHYLQNLDDDKYTLDSTDVTTGFTESPVGTVRSKTYEGFYSLLYDESVKIAADGSTVVDIYYDRYYYLMNFNLDGGYGVEPIYARYGAPISVGTPTKAGYTFGGWAPTVPSTMPEKGGTYTAQWIPGDSAKVTVVRWGENADDTNYSLIDTLTVNAKPDSQYTYSGNPDSKLWIFDSSETKTVAADGSTIVNVYYKRTTFTLTFQKYESSGFFSGDWKTVATIQAKWGAKIYQKFDEAPLGTTYKGYPWECTDSSKYSYALQTLDVMPTFDATFHLNDTSTSTKKTIYYYVQKVDAPTQNRWPSTNPDATNYELLKSVDTYFRYMTYNEEYHEIEGFTRFSRSDAGFDSSNKKNFSNNKAYLYYKRNSYTLSFYNYDAKMDRDQLVPYEKILTSYNFIPEYPASAEPNAYEFEGWYTDQYFRNKVDWNADKMPASDVMLYAHWVPISHTVTFAMDKDAQPGLYEAQTVPHGSKITAVDTPTNGQYTFVGWFYDDNGTEKAFDPANMPVNRDLNLYGKWSANTLVDYTIRYVTMVNGVEVEIAAPSTGKALALTTKTFEAKTGTDLNDGYQEGYFPTEASHSITMSAEQGAKNEFTFVYEPKEEVPYTVYYVTKTQPESGNYDTVEINGETCYVLSPTKVTASRNAIVTENYVPVAGYMPDQFQQRLILSANGENVLIFWYTKDTEHAPVRIVDHFQNIAGTGYAEGVTRSEVPGSIGQNQTADPLTNQPGFQYDHATYQTFVAGSEVTDVTDVNGHVEVTLTADGLQIDYYYNRIQYPYEFRFLEQGTNKKLADPITGNGLYQAQVTQRYKDIPGYTLVSTENLAITIAIEDTPIQNVAIFYYQEKDVTINYKIVGPDGCGSLSQTTETVKAVNGPVTGSTATATDNTYKFVGWFKDAACTQPVDESWITDTTHITPQKTGDKNEAGEAQTYEAATYYAKFEYNLTSMTITKSGTAYDSSDSFIFDIFDKNSKKVTTVTLHMNGSVTISGLTVGETYTVRERVTGTRYTATNNNQPITLAPTGNTVTINNSVKNNKWLTSSKTVSNVFNGKN